MRTVTVEITWPDARSIKAVAHYRALELGARVAWDGDAGIIARLPEEIAPGAGGERCPLDYLLTDAKNFAANEGAAFQGAPLGITR